MVYNSDVGGNFDNNSKILSYFERLESKVRINNSVGLTDVNSAAEDFFAGLLNKIFDLKLINLNLKKLNFTAIDLGDSKKRICFQVTSECGKQKIQETLDRFSSHKLYEDYDFLKFAIISSKRYNSKTSFVIDPNLKFDIRDDILTIPKLANKIRSLDRDKQKEILDFFSSEFDDPKKKQISNEVETLVDLIDFLTQNKEKPNQGWSEEPDPEGKIQHRFSEHSAYLREEIKKLIPIYSNAKEQVLNVRGYNLLEAEYVKIFLQNKSNEFLNRANGNPEIALDNLVIFFEENMGNSGRQYDVMAIRFYLIDELIKCNIFPN